MQVRFFDLSKQYEQLKQDIERTVSECFAQCAYIDGPPVKQLEHEMEVYLGVKHAITCGNGTDALKIALRACGVGAGDEVITTPFSFFATAEAISAVGAVPVFVDIDRDTLNLDSNYLESSITSKTKAILPVHIFGVPADMDKINAVAEKYSLKVIEDACQAIGASFRGKMVGNLGDAACFSFYPTKNLGAFGDGGMITTNDDEIAAICRAVKTHGSGKVGASAFAILNGVSEAVPECDAQTKDSLYDPYKYYNYLIGENSRLDSIQAGVLLAKLKHLDSFTRKRRRIAECYNEFLKGTPLLLPKILRNDRFVCWHQYAVMVPDKEAFVNYLTQRKVGTGAFYPIPLHLQKAFVDLGYRLGDLPVVEDICRQSVCLPIYPELTNEEQKYILECIKEYYGVL